MEIDRRILCVTACSENSYVFCCILSCISRIIFALLAFPRFVTACGSIPQRLRLMAVSRSREVCWRFADPSHAERQRCSGRSGMSVLDRRFSRASCRWLLIGRALFLSGWAVLDRRFSHVPCRWHLIGRALFLSGQRISAGLCLIGAPPPNILIRLFGRASI